MVEGEGPSCHNRRMMARARSWWGAAALAVGLVAGGCGEEEKTSEGASTGPSLSETCAAKTTRSECEAVGGQSNNGSASWCYWEAWVPVTLADGKCTLGAPVDGTCQVTGGGSEGCASGNDCAGGRIGQWREGAGGIEVSNAELCLPPENWCEVVDGVVMSGPPECACVCWVI